MDWTLFNLCNSELYGEIFVTVLGSSLPLFLAKKFPVSVSSLFSPLSLCYMFFLFEETILFCRSEESVPLLQVLSDKGISHLC